MTISERERFRSLIGTTLGICPDHVTLFAKGRVALFAILRALDIGPGDEVIIPAFTCVAVPNAILYTGAKPVWVDIDPRTLCIDASAASVAISTRTRAIVAQNTFGLSADLDAITAVAEPLGITVVDDCTHGLGGSYRGSPNGVAAEFSFFSTQWSKAISTGLGGFAVARDEASAVRLRALEDSAAEPSVIGAVALGVLLRARERAGNGPLFRAGRAAYRTLSRRGVVPGSSTQDELHGSAMPAAFMTRLSNTQARLGFERLGRLRAEVDRRRSIAHRYSAWLEDHHRTVAAEPDQVGHAFLRYPIRVSDRPGFTAAGTRVGIDIGDWFASPAHPVLEGLTRWGYIGGSAPNAEQACREVVNLPTDPTLSNDQVDAVLALLGRAADQIT